MAKLKANGRELARMKLVEQINSRDVVRRETIYVLMSNCRILKKLVVVFSPSEYSTDGKPRRHDYGWKRAQLATVNGKEPSNEEVERWVNLLERNGFQRMPTQ